MRALRLTLIAIGTLIWVPYLLAKYVLGVPVSVAWVLAIHIPCMVGALLLRLMVWHRRRNTP